MEGLWVGKTALPWAAGGLLVAPPLFNRNGHTQQHSLHATNTRSVYTHLDDHRDLPLAERLVARALERRVEDAAPPQAARLAVAPRQAGRDLAPRRRAVDVDEARQLGVLLQTVR